MSNKSSTTIKSTSENYHIKLVDGIRVLKKEKDKEALKYFESQHEAYEHGKKLARTEGVDLVLHDKEGKIVERRTIQE